MKKSKLYGYLLLAIYVLLVVGVLVYWFRGDTLKAIFCIHNMMFVYLLSDPWEKKDV